ncbi:lysophospholipid acyltransferase family protein [Alteribacter populi]|uniref:lysophospholipid acyltransferase family protein n=1 Tax=Alteribacter populi TaxID=2011011 RepID=UPI000BBAB4E7|nr:lysophospholipid acyltransferase family protein [Alteribacter populi]
MIRTVIWFIYFWLYLLKSVPSLINVKRLRKNNKNEEADARIKYESNKWARSLVKLSGARVHVHGKEKIPTNETLLIVCNHQGNFDIPIILGYLDLKISFISKVEVKKLPLIASWMEEMNCVFMDRKNKRQSIKSIIDGAENLKNGHHLVIFPEGTRSKGGPVGTFKQGSFKLATRSGATILPVTINGSYNIMEANGNLLKPCDVDVTILDPVRIHHQQKDMDGIALANYVQEHIKKELNPIVGLKENV